MRKHFVSLSFAVCLVAFSSCSTEPAGVTVSGVDATLPVNFQLTPAEIAATCEAEKAKFIAAIDEIGKLSADRATYQNAVLALEFAGVEFSNNLNPVNFLKYVSTDAAVRAAADACETQVSQLSVDLFVREDLFKALKAVEAKGLNLNRLDQKLLDDTISGFRRNGLDLDPAQRAIYVEKKKQLVKLEADFSTNLNEYKDELLVSKEELEGMPENFIQGLEKDEAGLYKLGMSYPHYYPIMENAKNADVRKRLEFKFNRRGGEVNRTLLEQAIALRHELATMLGYKTHAQFVLEKRMAKTPEQVDTFLKELTAKLIPVGQANLNELLELKREELNDPTVQTVDAWDWRYYDVQLKKKKHNIDTQKVKEYFPLEVVNKGMFEIYQQLLGVKFEAAPALPVWNKAVLPYRVLDKDNTTIAYFYMDLFPRPGKYSHAAAFTLLSGYQKTDGRYRAPVSSIVANFNPPLEGQPSLLEHSEVETLFHEFGHIMHQVLTTAIYPTYSGTSVQRDFVEAPSQMLENWVWETAPLEKLSGHYKNNAEKLPADMVQKLIAAKLVNSGIRYLRQASFATLDLEYHNTGANVDTTAVYAKAMKDIMLIPIQDGSYPQASFGHLMGGYDSGYYGYLWSEVYAADMYTRFSKEGLLNPTTGGDYRKWILEPGGSNDPFELLKGFLGREPNQEAFLKSLGLGD